MTKSILPFARILLLCSALVSQSILVLVEGFTTTPKGFLTTTPCTSIPLRNQRTSSLSIHHVKLHDAFRIKLSGRSLAATSKDVDSRKKKNPRLLLSLVLILTTTGLAVWKRQVILCGLDYVKNEWLLATLDKLNAAGPWGLIIYTLMFVLWEMTAGVTTPIETAAGMAFGPIKGILASGTGKILGAYFSFLLARYIFAEKVHRLVSQNELLSLMEESIQETPLRVALLCRFSPLPEIVKNGGMGIMPVQKRWFLIGLAMHGLSFTCLWTYMGVETARVLRGLPPSRTLHALVTVATWVGLGAPVMIGVWIKSLKEKAQRTRQ